MQPINYRRVVLGSLAASLILFLGETSIIVGLFRTTLMAAREAAHMPTTAPNPFLGAVEILLAGFVLTWFYAAIRPRFGPGPNTALRSGLLLWLGLVGLGTL